MNASRELKKITMSSGLVAIAFVIELLIKFVLPIFSMPFGGNFIGLSMLPLIFIGFLYGLKYGILACFVYGIFEIILAPSGYIIGWSFMLDYLLGFTAFGLTGLFVGKLGSAKWTIIGIAVAGFVRYLSVSFAGVIFWTEAANFDAWIYSFVVYNLGYMVTSTALTMIIALLIRKRVLDLNDQMMSQTPATS
ncbi:energy-coupled thiamine transporter ThiT [Peloplasma aerotolerans]|jgi:thiamine transporter|uniref:Energy-coupled thiamine transporter ThiT n=1 Tax=Peloplasma aerotolerans TaxID=3044389 RepID=A0AAW6U240_9MOLU|nr:energy-coupled thiamine transporter ThiT [Mariniplasma sp. M4Ah]MDI6452046.1 energy-coupled thiamine transporter ThiT [Mariniplasma sp. M4Ah]MDR4968227.1 energy-coupled thiamine transporter ThiT [Acholeplasmataceae bacterium]